MALAACSPGGSGPSSLDGESLDTSIGLDSNPAIDPSEVPDERWLGALQEELGDQISPFDFGYFGLDRDKLIPQVDWRDVGGVSFVTAPKNQGPAGTCVAFAATAAMESALWIQQSTVAADLSEQWLVQDCGPVDPSLGYYTSRIGDDIVALGMVRESQFPYAAKALACPSSLQPDTSLEARTSWYARTEDELRAAVAVSPLVVSMKVYPSFFTYDGGIYSVDAGEQVAGGHAVLLVGYDDEGGYWIAKNSWGTYWGEDGYFRIAYGESDFPRFAVLMELTDGDRLRGPRLLGYSGEGETDADSDGYTADVDCDDMDPDIHPDAPERCNGQDDDCDKEVDEGINQTWYTDGDGDGFGVTSTAIEDCKGGPKLVAKGGDCDDMQRLTYPGAPEICDGEDNDCDGPKDENVGSLWYVDGDRDGYGDPSSTVLSCQAAPNISSVNTDCDDTDDSVYPGAPEICDGADNDCDGVDDDGVKNTYYRDADGDGYGSSSTVARCSRPTGYATRGGDCDDSRASVHPGAAESCNGLDNDCDGTKDDGVKTTYYKDGDGDSYGLAGSTQQACSKPSGYATRTGDCDDSRSSVNPGAAEIAMNGRDDNCDNKVNEGFGLLQGTWCGWNVNGKMQDCAGKDPAVSCPNGFTRTTIRGHTGKTGQTDAFSTCVVSQSGRTCDGGANPCEMPVLTACGFRHTASPVTNPSATCAGKTVSSSGCPAGFKYVFLGDAAAPAGKGYEVCVLASSTSGITLKSGDGPVVDGWVLAPSHTANGGYKVTGRIDPLAGVCPTNYKRMDPADVGCSAGCGFTACVER